MPTPTQERIREHDGLVGIEVDMRFEPGSISAVGDEKLSAFDLYALDSFIVG